MLLGNITGSKVGLAKLNGECRSQAVRVLSAEAEVLGQSEHADPI